MSFDDATSGTRIKICGITTPDAAEAAIEAGADAIGLVLAENSPRRIDAATANAIAAHVADRITTVAVLQLQSAQDEVLVAWTGERCQLHGDEPDAE